MRSSQPSPPNNISSLVKKALSIEYYSGCGNLFFIGFEEDLHLCQKTDKERADLCALFQKPVDGILSLGIDEALHMNYFNSDGTRASMCGNGLRCLGHFASRHVHGLSTSFIMHTDVGQRRIKVAEHDLISTDMGPLPTVSFHPLEKHFFFCNTGVPHAVCIEQSLPCEPIEPMARPFRFHSAFGQGGANISYATYEIQQGQTLVMLRTYERGVERETGACGTGACAAATILHTHFACPFPFHVQFISQEKALIELKDHRLFLTAPATLLTTLEAHVL